MVETLFNFLDVKQREAFREKWKHVHKMFTKWSPFLPGDEVAIFVNKKALEKEINDLEDLSLAAYRAMKLLRKQVEDFESDRYFR